MAFDDATAETPVNSPEAILAHIHDRIDPALAEAAGLIAQGDIDLLEAMEVSFHQLAGAAHSGARSIPETLRLVEKLQERCVNSLEPDVEQAMEAILGHLHRKNVPLPKTLRDMAALAPAPFVEKRVETPRVKLPAYEAEKIVATLKGEKAARYIDAMEILLGGGVKKILSSNYAVMAAIGDYRDDRTAHPVNNDKAKVFQEKLTLECGSLIDRLQNVLRPEQPTGLEIYAGKLFDSFTRKPKPGGPTAAMQTAAKTVLSILASEEVKLPKTAEEALRTFSKVDLAR